MARSEAILQYKANGTERGKWHGARQFYSPRQMVQSEANLQSKANGTERGKTARGEAVTLFQGIRPLEGHRAVL